MIIENPYIMLASAGSLFLYAANHRLKLWLKILLIGMCIAGVWFYAGFDKLFGIFPNDPAYVQTHGHTPKKAYLHWREVYHYYLGGKYYRELGYHGLYETVALADSESAAPQLHTKAIRSLRNTMESVPIIEALEDARKEFRPRFTDVRWQEFKQDVETLKNIAAPDWLDVGMQDAGFNPPPTWAVIGTTVANLVPMAQENAWGGDLRPYWYQIEFLPLFDLLMLFTALAAVAWAFGFLGVTGFAFLFCLSYVASIGWIAGGFFRYTWLCELMIGVACLKKERYFWAGAFLGLCSADRIFTTAFLGASGLSLLFIAASRPRNVKPLVHFSAGALLFVGVITGVSILMFGMDAWYEFFEKILAHKDVYFVHHIGYKRIAVFDQHVPHQNFWWNNGLGLAHFHEWNLYLSNRWQAVQFMHAPFLGLMIAAAIFACRYVKPEEAALLLGGLLIFIFEIAANYYYIYFPLILTVWLASPKNNWRNTLIGSIFVLWAVTWGATRIPDDDITQNYYICWGFLLFFVCWTGSRTIEAIQHFSHIQKAEVNRLSASSPV